MHWFFLILAGLFEIGFTTFLKLSRGFTRVGPTIGFVLFAGVSFYLLTRAIERIPLGTAYAVWTGIGAGGTAVVGMIWFGDPVGVIRLALLATLVGSVIGLKVLT